MKGTPDDEETERLLRFLAKATGEEAATCSMVLREEMSRRIRERLKSNPALADALSPPEGVRPLVAGKKLRMQLLESLFRAACEHEASDDPGERRRCEERFEALAALLRAGEAL